MKNEVTTCDRKDAEVIVTACEAGVERLAGYLTSLPERSRSMWVDAAYEVWLLDRVAREEREAPTPSNEAELMPA
jgi:hypothetical protein